MLTLISTLTFTSTSSEENPAAGGLTDPAAVEDAPTEEAAHVDDTPTGPFSTMQNPNGEGELYVSSYDYTDDYGDSGTFELVIDPTTGNMAFGNSDEGYMIVCNGTDGILYYGTARGEYGKSIEGAAKLITDGHENSKGYNGILWTGAQSSYGFNYSVSPLPSVPESARKMTVNLNGTTVTVNVPVASFGPSAYLSSFAE